MTRNLRSSVFKNPGVGGGDLGTEKPLCYCCNMKTLTVSSRASSLHVLLSSSQQTLLAVQLRLLPKARGQPYRWIKVLWTPPPPLVMKNHFLANPPPFSAWHHLWTAPKVHFMFCSKVLFVELKAVKRRTKTINTKK